MNVRELVTVLKFKTDSASLKSAENAVNRIKTIMLPGGDRPTIRGEYYLINDDGTIERNETEDANDE